MNLRSLRSSLPLLIIGIGCALLGPEKPATGAQPLGVSPEAREPRCRGLEAAETNSERFDRDRGPGATLGAHAADAYRGCVAALAEAGHGRQALEVAERGRARAFRRLAVEYRRAALDREYDAIQAVLGNLHYPEDGDDIHRLYARLQEIYRQKEELPRRTKTSEAKAPLDLPAIRRTLDPGTALLVWSVSPDKTFLFVVLPAAARGDGLTVAMIPAGEAALRREIESFRRLVQDPASDQAAIKKAGAELYRQLVAPAEARLAGADQLLLAPDGPLRALPFAALVRPDGPYLVEGKALTTVLSATVYAETKARRRPRNPARWRLEAFAPADGGAAPSPGSRQEVEALAALFPTHRLFVGPAATEEAAKGVGRGVDLLDFDTRGMLQDAIPLNSGIALANGTLQAWEVIDTLRLDAELASISASAPALAKDLGGEGLTGLAGAFLHAGARSVLGTLWNAGDATPDLLTTFYTALRNGGDKSTALRRAQMRQLASPTRSHPAFWAAFELFGDGR